MAPSQIRVNEQRFLEDFAAISRIGATEDGGVRRPALSLEDLEARAWFADCIEEAGFFVRDDDAGNISGIVLADNPNARTLMIGSHLDSVPNGGRFDGVIGVLAGLEIARTLRDAGMALPFHLEIMNFTDEEGTWVSLLGSRGLTGRLPIGHLERNGTDTATMQAALARAGIEVDRLDLAERDPDSILGFLELHIEQGETLERLGAQIGVVAGIVGRTTHQLTFYGERGHSGTTDILKRKDALQGAALFVTRAHMLANERSDGTIVNCGNLSVFPGTFNVIPEKAQMLVECRHVDGDTLLSIEAELLSLAQECADIHRLKFDYRRVEHMDPARMHPDMVALFERICMQLDLRYTTLISYAGHDAQPMSHFTPTGLIFVPSQGGISHNSSEYTPWQDVVNGANVLLQAVLNIAQMY